MHIDQSVLLANSDNLVMRNVNISEKLIDICSDFKSNLVVKSEKFDNLAKNKREILEQNRNLLSQLAKLQKDLRELTLRDHDVIPRNLQQDPFISTQFLEYCSELVTPQHQSYTKNLDQNILTVPVQAKQQTFQDLQEAKRDKINRLLEHMAEQLS